MARHNSIRQILSPPVSFVPDIKSELSKEYEKSPLFLDCGSIQCHMPKEIECYFDIDQNDEAYLLHCVSSLSPGECIFGAYASPTGKNSWPELLADNAAQLRAQGVPVQLISGMWDQILQAQYGEFELYIVGYQGDRWILRAVIYTPSVARDDEKNNQKTLIKNSESGGTDWLNVAYYLMSNMRVNRGTAPMPVFSALPLNLPDKVINQLQQQIEHNEAAETMPIPELIQHYLSTSQLSPATSGGLRQIMNNIAENLA